MSKTYRVVTVIGARPQFVKAAIVSKALEREGIKGRIQEYIVHTGQHYDPNLSEIFFRELGLREPDYQLSVGSRGPGEQIGVIQTKLEALIIDLKPDAVLVYGDTNSTLAACVVANHHNIPLIHVEAGERIYRRFEVPEERNRVATDHLADLCMTCTAKATLYLSQEGIADSRIQNVGDPMWDLFVWGKSQLDRGAVEVRPVSSFGVTENGYVLATIHRAENTHDDRVIEILESFGKANLPVVLPAHPRLKKAIDKLGIKVADNVKLIEPLGYFEFLHLLLNAERVVTDSGGVTREAYFARKYSIIPMENSWWTEVVESGWAACTATDNAALVEQINGDVVPHYYPEGLFGDADSSSKIWRNMIEFLDNRQQEGDWHRHGNISQLPKPEYTDMSYTAFGSIVEQFQKADYEFRAFNDPRNEDTGKAFVLMRHDIDFSLEKALKMARLEQQAGVVSTYFFMLSGHFYNLFSAQNRRIVNEIMACGHHLGLHFDCAAYPEVDSVSDLNALVTTEVGVLESLIGKKVEVVSFHRPCKLVLTGDPGLTAPIVHTYMEKFVKDIEYCADSRGQWKYGKPMDREAFKQQRPMHLLIHPIWWHDVARGSVSTLEYFLKDKQNQLEQEMARNCAPYSFLLKEDA